MSGCSRVNSRLLTKAVRLYSPIYLPRTFLLSFVPLVKRKRYEAVLFISNLSPTDCRMCPELVGVELKLRQSLDSGFKY